MNPHPLDAASLRGLDWPVVVEAWAHAARTPMGAAAVRSLPPLPDRAAVSRALDGCAEVLRLEDLGTALPIGAVTDIREAVIRASKGLTLEGQELLAAGRCLRALLDLRKALDAAAEQAPTLAKIVSEIDIDPFVTETLEGSFDPTGQLSGSRYPELDELRQAITRLHDEVRGTLDRMVRGEELGDDLLQDRFWTVRENRYVLPVKAHAKRWDLGIVHGTSGTGRTVFVEPHAVIELNNRLRLAEGRLRAAEHAILTELSRELGSQTEIEPSTQAAIAIDLACARAGLARKLKGSRPVVGEGGRIKLVAARHPVLVLRGVQVVANDLELGPEHPVLVLSGPNAGGKTVAMKTIGLCAELVRHGNYIPAADDSRMDLFGAVRAAIGDQQTVEGDLSSFSAHLVTLEQMLQDAGPGQLILLDEIASGTDPSQGAALAQAVLERLADSGPRVVVTTHFAALKALAAADPRFAGAAVQYSEGRPTYRVLQGASGESHALSIARRVGISTRILARAEELIGAQELELGKLLSALEQERARAEAATDEAKRLRAEAEATASSLARREEVLRTKIRELEAKGAAAFLERLKSAERAIGQVVADLQRAPSHDAVRAARATVDALRGLAPGLSAETAPPEPEVLSVGDRVRHRKLGGVGEIQSVADGVYQVRIGALNVRAKEGELEPLSQGQRPKSERRGHVEVTRAPRSSAITEAVRLPSNTLDMRGMRVEEGQEAAEQFFDRAIRSGWEQVFLLHGHGTGALKDGLRGWLRTSAYVSEWAPAQEEQGGDAFTVVVLGR
jgi:DNA mismatch repair protein MutS2